MDPSGENRRPPTPAQSTVFKTRSDASATFTMPICAVWSFLRITTATHLPSGDQSVGEIVEISTLSYNVLGAVVAPSAATDRNTLRYSDSKYQSYAICFPSRENAAAS